MLVLSRQRDEILVATISPEKLRELAATGKTLTIETTVVDIRGDKVRLGIQAKADGEVVERDMVVIDRKEVAEARKQEAAQAKPDLNNTGA